MNKFIFTTSAGREIHFIPPSATVIELSEAGIREEYRKRGEPVDVPTYTVELGGSTPEKPITQTFEYDAKYAEKDEETQAKWKAHLDCITRLEKEIGNMRTNICLEALEITLPEDTTWMVKQKKKFITIPEDPDELLMHYIKTEVLRTMDDIYSCMSVVLTSAYSGSVDEEAVEAASKTFRRKLQEATVEATQAAGEPGKNGEGSGELESL